MPRRTKPKNSDDEYAEPEITRDSLQKLLNPHPQSKRAFKNRQLKEETFFKRK